MVKVLTVGTFTVDIVASGLPKVAEPGEIVNVDTPIDLYIGGHASNVAIDLIKLGVKGRIVACGAVGDDVFARIIRDELSKYGVEFRPMIVKEAGTARNAILVVNGEDRRFHIYPGANRYLRPDHVLEVLRLTKPDYMYIAIGFSKSLDLGLRSVVEEAKRLGTFILLDVARMSDHCVKAINNVMDLIDIAHLNYLELSALIGEPDLLKCSMTLSKRPRFMLTITYGEVGAKALFKNYVISQPSFKVGSKDPTGAGDAFSAGIISYLINYLRGKNLDEVSINDVIKLLMYSQASGASATLAPGATTSVSDEVVKSLIENQGQYLISSTKVYSLEGK